jgi:cytochrome subunit of sulfide dehydrogenase
MKIFIRKFMTCTRTWLSGAVSACALLLPAASSAQFVANDARLLASGCFQCHGTNGKSGTFDALAGDGKLDMLNKLNDMRKKSAGSSIMVPHARGYTSQQLNMIADYFSKQK